MSKIIWIIVIGWVLRSVFTAVKKAISEAKAEIEAEKARQAAGESPRAPSSTNTPPAPQATPPGQEDPRAALLRMLAAAGVSPGVTKVVESTIDYDDAAGENRTDYDDDSDEDDTDYDDAAAESRTDYDDDSAEDKTDYDDVAPAPPVVYALPAPPTVYAIADDTTSAAANAYVRADIESHMRPDAPARQPVHGLDTKNIHSRELVRDSVILDVLLRRHPGNPFFLRRR
ncbi:MAG: hypothetical protein ACAI38_20790 [Myxococcota bacterium]|nr:hypothetical protein [Myxococcota bacterium]